MDGKRNLIARVRRRCYQYLGLDSHRHSLMSRDLWCLITRRDYYTLLKACRHNPE